MGDQSDHNRHWVFNQTTIDTGMSGFMIWVAAFGLRP